jgi:hypothetical protein
MSLFDELHDNPHWQKLTGHSWVDLRAMDRGAESTGNEVFGAFFGTTAPLDMDDERHAKDNGGSPLEVEIHTIIPSVDEKPSHMYTAFVSASGLKSLLDDDRVTFVEIDGPVNVPGPVFPHRTPKL